MKPTRMITGSMRKRSPSPPAIPATNRSSLLRRRAGQRNLRFSPACSSAASSGSVSPGGGSSESSSDTWSSASVPSVDSTSVGSASAVSSPSEWSASSVGSPSVGSASASVSSASSEGDSSGPAGGSLAMGPLWSSLMPAQIGDNPELSLCQHRKIGVVPHVLGRRFVSSSRP